MRRLTYRHALTGFFFTFCWLVLGFLLVISGIPGKLGIGSDFGLAWFAILILSLGGGGALLTLASYNGLFPPAQQPPGVAKTASSSRTTPKADGVASRAWSRPLPSRTATGRTSRQHDG
jgi:hypothetical protein